MNPVFRNLLLLVVVCFSCKPALHTTISSAPKPFPDPNGTKLYRILVLNKEQPGKDIDIYEYHYDCFNRITDIGEYRGDSVNGQLQQQYSTGQKFYYNAGDLLPYKSVGSSPFDSAAVSYYLFDNYGRLIVDSISFSKDKNYTLYTYNWQIDYVIKSSKTPYGKQGYIFSNDSFLLNNQNIAGRVKLEPMMTDLRITAGKYAYDDKVNPVNSLNISPIIALSRPDAQLTYGYNKNNMIWIGGGFYNYNHTFIQREATHYIYKYNSAGLPVECEISGSKYKWLLQYY